MDTTLRKIVRLCRGRCDRMTHTKAETDKVIVITFTRSPVHVCEDGTDRFSQNVYNLSI